MHFFAGRRRNIEYIPTEDGEKGHKQAKKMEIGLMSTLPGNVKWRNGIESDCKRTGEG